MSKMKRNRSKSKDSHKNNSKKENRIRNINKGKGRNRKKTSARFFQTTGPEPSPFSSPPCISSRTSIALCVPIN